jgi:hypothetical protein
MRNHIPKVKTLKYTKSKEEIEDTDDGRITLIKSDNPTFEWEAYHFKTGTFLGYLSPRKQEKREDKIESSLETIE